MKIIPTKASNPPTPIEKPTDASICGFHPILIVAAKFKSMTM